MMMSFVSVREVKKTNFEQTEILLFCRLSCLAGQLAKRCKSTLADRWRAGGKVGSGFSLAAGGKVAVSVDGMYSQ